MSDQETRYAEWHKLIDEQEKSGMNQEAFCKMKDLSVAKLQYYRKKMRKTHVQSQKKFTEIKFTNTVSKPQIVTKEIKLILQNGIQCFLPLEIDPKRAKNLIEVLLTC